MGTDISCYIEYRHPRREGKWSWDPFGGRINPGRNYTLFGLMAGVRSTERPVVERKGIPDDIGYEANDDYYLYVNDANHQKEYEGYTSTIKAMEYAENDGCRLVYETIENIPTLYKVTNPDAKYGTWLTIDEFLEALVRYGALTDMYEDDLCEYWAMYHAMDSFKRLGYDTRLIVWFDQ